MSRSEEMDALAENMAASYDERRATLERIAQDTHELLERFHEEDKQRAQDLKQQLASYEKERKEATAHLMEKIRGELADLKRETHNMLAQFAEENRRSHDSWVNLTKKMAAKRAEARNSRKS